MTAPLSRSEIASLARVRFGSPNQQLSRGNDLRFGNHGSTSVDLLTGAWFSHQEGIGGYLADPGGSIEPAIRTSSARRGEAKRWSRQAEEIWTQAKPSSGTVVELYLRARGCWVDGVAALRFLPNWCGWPAMVALVTDAITNLPTTLHFTLLRRDGSGKAPVDKPKLLLKGHRKAGGVIRLSPDDEVTMGLGIGEGIETSLSVMAADWRPIWATVDAGNMRTFPVLPGVEALTLFSDHDPAGIAAARECARRWERAGREAAVVMPTGRGADYNDTIRGEAR